MKVGEGACSLGSGRRIKEGLVVFSFGRSMRVGVGARSMGPRETIGGGWGL